MAGGLCAKMLKLLLFISTSIPFSLTNNIDINVSPIRKRGTVGSYFGFSATGYDEGANSWVAVGSPKANSTKILFNGKQIEETGALYRCEMNMDQYDCSDISVPMLEKVTKAHVADPTNGWYGVSLAGGKKNEDLLVCSHRLAAKYCNTNGQCIFGLPGGCKKAKTRTSVFGSFGDIFIIDDDNKADLSGTSQDSERQVSYMRSQFGQTGIGSIAAKFKGDDFLAGAVGERSWTGAVVSKTLKVPASTETYAYGGYSIASGDFFTFGETAYAFSAPRYELKGAVFVDKTMDNITSAIIIKGHQDGSYFGMSICASDFDGDQISEIAVGAPYYTKSLNEPASGMVYVYSNKNSFKKPVQTLKAEKSQARALYGRCVGAIGDVDLDGYNDLGVGAPYEENGGALYIYHGSSAGLYATPVQIIRANDLPFAPHLNTFGWSVQGQIDLDQNGYPDLVVGAYTSDSIVILRSLPIAVVTSFYKLSPETIDVSNRNCSVSVPNKGDMETVCFDIEIHASYVDKAKKMKNEIELTFLLEADTLVKDPKKRRVMFQNNHLPTLKIENEKVQNANPKLVYKTTAYIVTDLCPDCEDKISPFPDIQMKLTPKLPTRSKPPKVPESGDPPSLEKYFQLPFYTQVVDFRNVTSKTIRVKRECNPCKPNLKIENIGTTSISVKAQSVHLKIEISNAVDKAYEVVSKIFLPPKLRAVPCVKFEGLKCLWTECEVRKNETEMICDLGHINANTSKEYAIKLDTILASQSTGEFDVMMNVTSGSPEEPALLGDNTLELVLKVASQADIHIFQSTLSTETRFYGGSIRGQYSMTNEKQIGLIVKHIYMVGNKGPDVVPEVNITVEWPYEAESGKHLLYLLNITDNSKVKCFTKPEWVNPLANQFKRKTFKKEVLNNTISRRKRRDAAGDATDKKSSAVVNQLVRTGGSKVVLDCRNGTAKCRQILCRVKNIKDKENVVVAFISRIWNGTLLEDYKGRDVVVVSHARIINFTNYVTDPDRSNHEVEISTGFFPASPKTTKKGIAVWIIVVSVIAGIVLLVILIVVFKMCGFFKRMDTGKYNAVPAST